MNKASKLTSLQTLGFTSKALPDVGRYFICRAAPVPRPLLHSTVKVRGHKFKALLRGSLSRFPTTKFDTINSANCFNFGLLQRVLAICYSNIFYVRVCKSLLGWASTWRISWVPGFHQTTFSLIKRCIGILYRSYLFQNTTGVEIVEKKTKLTDWLFTTS